MLAKEPLNEAAKAYPLLNLEEIEDTVLATIINKKILDIKRPYVKKERTLPLRSLKKALTTQKRRHFILECKQSSPTLGDFCEDFNLDKLIACYEKYADAISVLCEEHFFKGSINYLQYVKERTHLPVLCKDFIISKQQIDEAYAHGADAILLMLSVLKEDAFLELYEYAKSLSLDVLCEVDNEKQAQFAKDHKIEIVGFNNRNLRTLTISLDNALQLRKIFHDETVLVSESGINDHTDLTYVHTLDNFLIGSAITKEQDVAFKTRALQYGLNKICGITTEEALKTAITMEASIAGLIFVKESPRYLKLEKAAALISPYRGHIKFCGVFLDEKTDTICEYARKLNLDYIQLHGSETQDTITSLRARLQDIKIIKAININNKDDFLKIKQYQNLCDLIILDSKAPGSGSSFNWSAIPKNLDKRKILLSGGIGPDNVKEALAQGFVGLDLNSKLEKIKGVKEPSLIRATFDIINNY